jgi:hypothetical protein
MLNVDHKSEWNHGTNLFIGTFGEHNMNEIFEDPCSGTVRDNLYTEVSRRMPIKGASIIKFFW